MATKVLLIGNSNGVTKELSQQLTAEGCQVQLCSDSAEIAKEIVRQARPDVAVIFLSGSLSAHEELFSLLLREKSSTQIALIGNRSSERDLEELGILQDGRFLFIRRPVTMLEIVEQIKPMLNTAPAPAAEPELKPRGREKQRTILVVDDNPSMLRTMQAMLTSRQYRVTFATSGPQAIATIAKERPDLILLDYEMPVVNGKMTLEMLRSEESTKDIPVVFLTGMDDKAHVEEVLALKPEGYLLKPPPEARIFEAIEQILGKHR